MYLNGFTSVPTGRAARVLVTREPFSDFYSLSVDNGQSEELEIEDVREWFLQHGANMDVVQKALDHVWNFYSVEIVIGNFCIPKKADHAYAPKLD